MGDWTEKHRRERKGGAIITVSSFLASIAGQQDRMFLLYYASAHGYQITWSQINLQSQWRRLEQALRGLMGKGWRGYRCPGGCVEGFVSSTVLINVSC